MSNCMDDFEVALQGDDDKTDISSVHTKDLPQTFKLKMDISYLCS